MKGKVFALVMAILIGGFSLSVEAKVKSVNNNSTKVSVSKHSTQITRIERSTRASIERTKKMMQEHKKKMSDLTKKIENNTKLIKDAQKAQERRKNTLSVPKRMMDKASGDTIYVSENGQDSIKVGNF